MFENSKISGIFKKNKNFIFSLFFILLVLLIINYLFNMYKNSSSYMINKFVPSEKTKIIDFTKFNDFPLTLEEEMVEKMAPPVYTKETENLEYKPILENNHNAASIDM
jgi:hypothetical protein